MAGHGRFNWYDLMTPDPEAAQAFYTQLVGWGTQQWQGPMPYSMWTRDGAPLGGVMQLPAAAEEAGAPPHWMVYVKVDDVDATIAKAAEIGATTMVPPQEIPETGRFAVLADPLGAVFAVFTALNDDGTCDDPAPVGTFSWHELATEDQEVAWGFYSDLFGWSKGETYDMGEMGPYQSYSRRDGLPAIGGMFNKPAEMPNAWLLYVRVDDVEASAGKVTELGGQVLNGPMEVPGGDKVAQCLDPQGAFFAIHSTRA